MYEEPRVRQRLLGSTGWPDRQNAQMVTFKPSEDTISTGDLRNVGSGMEASEGFAWQGIPEGANYPVQHLLCKAAVHASGMYTAQQIVDFIPCMTTDELMDPIFKQLAKKKARG